MRWQQPAGVRRVALVVGACMVGVAAWAFIATGPSLGIVLFTGVGAVGAGAAFRQRVTVEGHEITICNGLLTWRVGLDEIDRVQWLPYQQVPGWLKIAVHSPWAGGLYVVRAVGWPVAVPRTSVGNVERPNRRATAMATWFATATGLPVVEGEVEEPDEWDWD